MRSPTSMIVCIAVVAHALVATTGDNSPTIDARAGGNYVPLKPPSPYELAIAAAEAASPESVTLVPGKYYYFKLSSAAQPSPAAQASTSAPPTTEAQQSTEAAAWWLTEQQKRPAFVYGMVKRQFGIFPTVFSARVLEYELTSENLWIQKKKSFKPKPGEFLVYGGPSDSRHDDFQRLVDSGQYWLNQKLRTGIATSAMLQPATYEEYYHHLGADVRMNNYELAQKSGAGGSGRTRSGS